MWEYLSLITNDIEQQSHTLSGTHKKLLNDFRYMKLCCLRLTTDLVLYMACTEKVHANYYSAQTEMLEIFSSINILSAKLLLTRHGDISAVLKNL